jgi:hypothetical protein
MQFSMTADTEKDAGSDFAHLTNTSIHSFSWDNITVTVKERQTKLPKDILSSVSGVVKAGMFITVPPCTTVAHSTTGEMLALMGPR